MNDCQRFAFSHPITRVAPRAIKPEFHLSSRINEINATSTLILYGSFDGEPPLWFSLVMVLNDEGALLCLSDLSEQGFKSFVAFGLDMLDGVGEDDRKIVTGSAIHIFKNLSKEESDSPGGKAKLPARPAVSRVSR